MSFDLFQTNALMLSKYRRASCVLFSQMLFHGEVLISDILANEYHLRQSKNNLQDDHLRLQLVNNVERCPRVVPFLVILKQRYTTPGWLGCFSFASARPEHCSGFTVMLLAPNLRSQWLMGGAVSTCRSLRLNEDGLKTETKARCRDESIPRQGLLAAHLNGQNLHGSLARRQRTVSAQYFAQPKSKEPNPVLASRRKEIA